MPVQRKTRAGPALGETPAPFGAKLEGFVPGTVVRAPTMNETIYSANGESSYFTLPPPPQTISASSLYIINISSVNAESQIPPPAGG